MFGEKAELQVRIDTLEARLGVASRELRYWQVFATAPCPVCRERDQAELDKLAKRNREDEIRKIVEPIVKRELAAAKSRR